MTEESEYESKYVSRIDITRLNHSRNQLESTSPTSTYGEVIEVLVDDFDEGS